MIRNPRAKGAAGKNRLALFHGSFAQGLAGFKNDGLGGCASGTKNVEQLTDDSRAFTVSLQKLFPCAISNHVCSLKTWKLLVVRESKRWKELSDNGSIDPHPVEQ